MELGPPPDIARLEELFERVRATGLDVGMDVEGVPFTLGPATELTVYRILQEALTNAIKHASATEVHIVLRYSRPFLELTVLDDGSARPRRRKRTVGTASRAWQSERACTAGSLRAGPGRGRRLGRVGRVAARYDRGQDVTDPGAPRRRPGAAASRLSHDPDQEPDIEVVGEAGDGEEAIALASRCDPGRRCSWTSVCL